MRSILFSLAFASLLLSALVSRSYGAEFDPAAEDYFSNLTSQERFLMIANMQVTPAVWTNADGRLDVLEDLNKNCRGVAHYERDGHGKIQWPKVSCRYLSEKSFDGMTPKFKCEFTDDHGRIVKAKVKYAETLEKSSKEIAPAILVSGLTRLLGYASDTYCPAEVLCEGCSSHPWVDMQRSSMPAQSGLRSTFKNAVIEMKLEGARVSEPRNGAPKPLGWAWEELAQVPASLPVEEKLSILAERESFMLWINLIYHMDADAHNNRLLCEQWTSGQRYGAGSMAYRCDRVVGYAHDFGDALVKMNYWGYREAPVFLTSLVGSPSLWFKKCVGGLVGGEGAIRRAVFSEEARRVFLERSSKLRWEQVTDILELTRIEELTGHSSKEWTELFFNKFQEVNAAHCDSLSSGETVLSKGLFAN